MPKFTPKEKLDAIKGHLLEKGKLIIGDERLNDSPYRAMQEEAGKELGQPYIKGHYTFAPDIYDLRTNKDKEKLAMDINHEDIENKVMKKGLPYKKAHKIANRKQRNFEHLEDK